MIINGKGEIINFVIIQGNVDDRKLLSMDSFIEKASGKLYADRECIPRNSKRSYSSMASTLFIK
ncbi:transposase [Parabacteroides sp. OttesenSCG-928-J18]|nr:transposase [Parabacteroides sp. OttesenSCG-928-J18]